MHQEKFNCGQTLRPEHGPELSNYKIDRIKSFIKGIIKYPLLYLLYIVISPVYTKFHVLNSLMDG